MKLIDASAFLEKLPTCGEMSMKDVRLMLQTSPAADAEIVRHGTWREMRDPYGKLEGWIHEDCGYSDAAAMNYCATCGAKMKFVKNDAYWQDGVFNRRRSARRTREGGHMKASEIVVGGIYSNGKGRTRTVIAEGDFAYAEWASDHDYVKYEILHGEEMPRCAGRDIHEMTRVGFARWAKERVG